MRTQTLLTLILSLCFAAPALAQPGKLRPEATGAERGNEQVLKTRLYEAYAKGEWQEATIAFNNLRDNFQGTLDNKPLVFLNAQALYNLKKADQARNSLEMLISLQDDHIGGLYLLAKIYAASKTQPQDGDKAKEYLLASARAGQYVLRDINSKEGKKVFGKLLKDPTFILRVMNASNEFAVSPQGLRNPFKSPLRRKDPDDNDGGPPPKPPGPGNEINIKLLEQEIEVLFGEIERLAQDRQVEELIGKFTQLRDIMNRYGKDGSDIVKKKMESWSQRLQAFGEVQLSIQLQIYINEGNQHLRTMAEAIRNEDYAVALERFEQIKELKEQMYSEDREVFHRNAEALYLRGKALADRAARLKRISEFTLVVTGIIVAPPNSDEKDSAIVNDRIYQEGDSIIDDATDEEIDDLTVVEIIRSTVRFQYEDTEFVRELKSAQ